MVRQCWVNSYRILRLPNSDVWCIVIFEVHLCSNSCYQNNSSLRQEITSCWKPDANLRYGWEGSMLTNFDKALFYYFTLTLFVIIQWQNIINHCYWQVTAPHMLFILCLNSSVTYYISLQLQLYNTFHICNIFVI